LKKNRLLLLEFGTRIRREGSIESTEAAARRCSDLPTIPAEEWDGQEGTDRPMIRSEHVEVGFVAQTTEAIDHPQLCMPDGVLTKLCEGVLCALRAPDGMAFFTGAELLELPFNADVIKIPNLHLLPAKGTDKCLQAD